MKHLSEEQLYEVLDARMMGSEAPGAVREHVDACAQCRTEVEAVHGSLEGLRAAANGMARSGFRPLLPAKRAGYFSTFRFAWPLALAAAGLVCAASVTVAHRPMASGSVQVQRMSEAAATDADDALLDGIDQDLSAPVPPSLAPLNVSSGEGAAKTAKLD